MTGLPTMPPGWRPTIETRPVVIAGGWFSQTHRERLWIYDPTNSESPADQPEAERQWVEEPNFDGRSTCCP